MKPGSGLIAMLLVAATVCMGAPAFGEHCPAYCRSDECPDLYPAPVSDNAWQVGQWGNTITFGVPPGFPVKAEHMLLLKNGNVLAYGELGTSQCLPPRCINPRPPLAEISKSSDESQSFAVLALVLANLTLREVCQP